MNYRDSKARIAVAGSDGRQSFAHSSDAQSVGASSVRYGATPEEWAHFSDGLGLTEHLLPTVANPLAKPSPRSRVTSPGKVPTMYDASRRYYGITNWPERHSTRDYIRHCSQEPDYGICLQARAVRGVDIDVNDPVLAKGLVELAEARFGHMPQRYRKGSGRVLLPFLMDCPLRKRSVSVVGGMVEVLGDRNQFLVAGQHVSGERYAWRDGLPNAIPSIDQATFEEFWSDLEMIYGTGESSTASSTPRRRGPTIPIHDPAAEYLRDSGLVLRERSRGVLDVECPWGAEHSSGEAGDGSTTYFQAGTNGYTHGTFICKHTSHGPHGTREYLRTVGYVHESDMPEVEFDGLDDAPASSSTEVLQSTQVTQLVPAKHGKGGQTLSKIAAALRQPVKCGKRIGLDSFCGEVMLAEADGEPQWREISDVDNTRLREHLQRVCGFGSISRELMRDVLEMVAEENSFDSAQVWLKALPWDGVPRIDTFLCRYFGCADTPYTLALSRYIWSALAGRVLDPGCKADMVPVAVGKQGTGKSRAIAAMAPSDEMFGELALDLRDSDTSRRLRGKLVVELPELSGLTKRDAESLKALLSAISDEWVPKYKERAVRHRRRLLFFGSSNREDFLMDETGHRRWLPFRSGDCDPDAVARDRDQLWAEGREVYLASGVAFQEAERLARDEHEGFTETDAWTASIAAWLDGQVSRGLADFEDEVRPEGKMQSNIESAEGSWLEVARATVHKVVTVTDVLVHALQVSKGQISRSNTMRVAKILKQLGWMPERRQVNGVRERVFVRPGSVLD